MMNMMVNKLTSKISKILIPIYIIVAILSPVSSIAFADTGSNLAASNLTGFETYAIENSWSAEDFTYDTNNATVITGFSENGIAKLETNKDLIIPAENVSGTAIKSIGASAFKGKELTSVYFPDTIEVIGNSAFSTNKISGELKLPESLSSLGQQAFMKNEITDVEIPRSITIINAGVFNTNKLTKVTIHNKINTIGGTAFGANQIEAVIFEENRASLPDGVDIQTAAFGNNKLETVRLPYNVKGIASNAFMNNLGNDPVIAKLVYLYTENPSHFTNSKIYHYDAEGSQRSGSAKLILEERPWSAEDFTYDTNNATVITGFSENGIAKLETNKDLIIPAENVSGTAIKSIGASAFKGKELTSVYFPDTIEVIGNSAFNTNKISGELKLPESLSSLGQQAFMKNEITDVEIPRSITIINAGVFNTNKLTKVTIHNKINTIGGTAFGANQIEAVIFEENCASLPDGVDIQTAAFGNNKLETVRLPYNVKGIASNAFMNNLGNDPDIAKLVYLYTENPSHFTNPKIYHYDAEGSQRSGSAKLILEEKAWSAEDFLYDTNNATIITGFSTEGLQKLDNNKELEIPLKNKDGNIITAIGANAFVGKGLTKVVFPEGLNNFLINGSAFMNNDISEVTLRDGIRDFESQCFRNNKITSLSLPQSTVKVGNSAFMKNEITSLVIADTREKIQIDGNSFEGNKIKSFVLPHRVEKVADTALMNNPGMEPSSMEGSGIVYMYTLNAQHFKNDRICRIGGTNPSPYQKLILSDSEISDEWEVTDFIYEGSTITGLSEEGQVKAAISKKLVLPDVNPQGEKITEIAAEAFGIADEDVELNGNEVTSPHGFTSVVFPKELKLIGDRAFRYNNFTDLSFPQTLEHIGMMAFNGNKLTTVILPENLTSMGNGAFGVNKITTLEINHKLKVIPTGAFTANTTLTNLDIPEGVEEIGSSAFRGAQLKTLTISSTVEKIGDDAFILHRLNTLTIPGNVKHIGSNAFEGNTNAKTLKSIILNEGLETISKGAFNKNLLERVELPSSVIFLDSKSFADNAKVVDVYTINEAHKDFQADVNSHKIIYFDPNELWTSEDFTYEGTTLTGFSDAGKIKAVEYRYVVLPDTNPEDERITKIGKEAFVPEGYEFDKEEIISPNGINKVVLPEYVEIIDERAFQYNNLITVEFPNSLHTLKQQSFNGNKLQRLVIPPTVINIEEGVFSTNKLKEVTLPDNIKIIPKGLFARNITLQQIEIPYGVEIIDEYAFNGAQLKTLNLPSTVVEIKRGAFYYNQIKELEIPGNVKVLGPTAFSQSIKAIRLEKLILNEGLKEIGSKAFAVSLLKEVKLPNSLEKLEAGAFEHNIGYEGSGRVNLYTSNKAHLDFPESESYIIIYKEPDDGGNDDNNNNNSGGKDKDDKNNSEDIQKPDDKESAAADFTDIENHWAKNSINFVIEQGLFYGISDSAFAPDNPMTRSMLVTVLYRYEKSPEIGSSTSFNDVDRSSWYGNGVVWAADTNIVNGISDGLFAPNENLTREQLVVILYRYAQYKGIDVTAAVDLSSYDDSNEISDWSHAAMEWAVSAGLLQGRTDKILAPGNGVTRGEVAAILTRFIEKILQRN